uniref:SSURE domain-containing protein n=1 Tax=uncultured Streptococcus sp. TaxID=83427 RepID=UPI0025D16A56
ASYLEKANVPGPFLAGVNQVIPYEAFGGDGMLTRLLLKASDKAPWSDNGSAKNPALLPLEGLAKGQYFYEVDLNDNTTGKDGQALLDQLRINGTHAYQATVKVYGAKDGKPDLTNLIATRQVIIRLYGKEMSAQPYQQEQMNVKPSTTDSMSTAEGTKEVDHRMTDVKAEHPTSMPMADTMKKNDKPSLPKTGEAQTSTATIGFFGLALAGILGFLGLKEKQKD